MLVIRAHLSDGFYRERRIFNFQFSIFKQFLMYQFSDFTKDCIFELFRN